ncbi:saccharopine dehydrogenase NADP-binding domain-containing protein [Nocardia sp. 2]|uniref:Saccharopine dehydrogenase NADP-binding domain-containing protein n=1 Tax=Nocardia acididurans TaxID=2802282 RepID=A0ABS1MFM4_9NOCA|nr:saccharopine dehydrogenase NADP-binding domain-containing protein [Nocardia acididurans]MBL1079054.1 saccharopine dehydrogenase NADP-binding domain-containing protein [Nocardia acididurans]
MTIYAVYGATGHTGRLVTTELLSRGKDVVLSGRDSSGLAALGHPRIHVAAADDPDALHALAETADVLINCAGPFAITGQPVAQAAAEAGCHYVDHSVEIHPVRRIYDTLTEQAQRAGITMIPSLSFYGGLGDLLAGAVARAVPDIDRITVAYAVTNWKMTTGAVNTARLLFADTERIGYENGALRTGFVEPRNAVFAFPPPVGPRTVIAPVPFPEPFTIPRHTPVCSVEAQLTARTFEEEQAFTSEHVDSAERAASEFTIAAQVLAANGSASGSLRGRDLWRAGALASVEAAVRIAEGAVKSGVLAPADAFDARDFLRTLADRDAFTLDLPAES